MSIRKMFEKAYSNKSYSSNYEGVGTLSATQVINANQDLMQLKGDWKYFLGEPEKNFCIIVAASPGYGKSTFCLKFANYLAKNHGKTLYLTNEENVTRVKTKLNLLNESISNNFLINFDSKSIDDICRNVAKYKPQFVIIDSMQNIGIDYKELSYLRSKFPQIGVTAINYSTKGGGVRGKQDKEYQGDCTIVFEKRGIATTKKNRFGEAGKNFVLFKEK